MVFLSQDSDTARTSGLAVYAKAVNKTNLGRRLLMLTFMKPRLLRSQKSANESTWGVGVELGAARINLYITRGTEEEWDKDTAKGYQNWSSSAFRAESKAGFWVR